MTISLLATAHHPPDGVTHVASGCFRTPEQHDVLVGRETHIELLVNASPNSQPDGLPLESLFIQPLSGVLRDLAVLPPTVRDYAACLGTIYPLPQEAGTTNRVAVLTTESKHQHTLQVLQYSGRFVTLQTIALPRLGAHTGGQRSRTCHIMHPGYAPHASNWRLAADAGSGAVAVTANSDRILLLPAQSDGTLRSPGTVYVVTEHEKDRSGDAILPGPTRLLTACFIRTCDTACGTTTSAIVPTTQRSRVGTPEHHSLG